MSFASFDDLFLAATGNGRFPYQKRFAEAPELPELAHAPTGAGKTAAAVLGWVWRRFYADQKVRDATPRRLVYCLPMRVLVEQTRDNALLWLHRLGLLDARDGFDATNPDQLESYRPRLNDDTKHQVAVHVLMGGEEADDWDLYPERSAVLIGTQDMLLSRVLNRGYGMGRFRWPMHYALLNTDCLWVLDEVQLMGTGLATSTQLQAFRERLRQHPERREPEPGPAAKTVWMSATLLRDWLGSVDFRDRATKLEPLTLEDDDYAAEGLKERWEAAKPVEGSGILADETNPKPLAAFVKEKHQPGSLTLVIVNTVERCRKLFEAMKKEKGLAADLKLIHSRFRPHERQQWREWLKPGAEIPPAGQIIVSTQVVEAGVDLSARTLVTELAPWPSLVQRFGRCNRFGEYAGDTPARVFWVTVEAADDKEARPYLKAELDAARSILEGEAPGGPLPDVGLRSLDEFFRRPELDREKLFPFDPPHVVRRKDFVDLFDTTPDLAGNDIDVARFIREGDELDVQVFWRDGPPDPKWPKAEVRRQAPRREELCPVSFVRFRDDFLGDGRTAYRWDALAGRWGRAGKDTAVFPGQVYWVESAQGGYDQALGWNPTTKPIKPVPVVPPPPPRTTGPMPRPEMGYDADDFSVFESSLGWQPVSGHTQEVCAELDKIAAELPLTETERQVLRVAARWHDWGKAHEIFQSAITKPADGSADTYYAKAPDGCWAKYKRKHFRHELASALGVLTLLNEGKPPSDWAGLSESERNLALYLIAAHHGKVRLSIRSMPGEKTPAGGVLFARGVWQSDPLPSVELGGDVTAPDVVKLDLSPMLLGQTGGRPSWAERMLGLRDDPAYGPLRLAYLEAILRAADMRASIAADARAKAEAARLVAEARAKGVTP